MIVPNAQEIAALDAEKTSRTPVQRKIDSNLLYLEKKARRIALPAHFPALQTGITVDAAGQVVVDVKARMTLEVLRDVQSTGGHIVVSVAKEQAMRLRMPLAKLEQLAASPDVAFIKPAEQAETQAGSVTSEGDHTQQADTARMHGVDGTGVKIGVLSDGVDSLATSQATSDLPATVTVLPGQDGDGDEGTAMLEIVHDVAPGAQLYFATAFDGEASFAQNIRALRAAGCAIIIDDVYYFAEGRFQDDTIAQAVNEVTAGGALYFSSAGNSGNADDGTSGMWEGNFVPYVSGGVTYADFDPSAGVQNADPVALISSTRPAVLQWADPLGASNNDYDLYLVNSSGNILATSSGYQTGTQDPYERVDVAGSGSGGTTGRMMVVRKWTGAARYMGLTLNRGKYAASYPFRAFATASQTSGHAAALNGFGVAAAPAHDPFGAGQPSGPYPGVFTSAQRSETFTSDGPRRVFYNSAGSPYTPGNYTATGGSLRQKPDITAADGVATTVPGFIPFYGTSAAAPHAGAIAALLLQDRPGMTRAQVRAALTGTAIDIEGAGWDRDTGYGIINANAAVAAVHAGNATAAFQTSTRTVLENAGTISLTVVRGGNTAAPLSMSYSRTAGSATPTSDFVLAPGTVSFGPGQTSRTIPLKIVNDAYRESAETIVVTLSNPGAWTTLKAPTQMTVTILASDQRPDGWIRSSLSPVYIGNNIYNTTAMGQTKIVTAHRREGRSFYVRIFNDGSSTNTFVIRGSAATPGGSVRYYYNGTTDVTTAMRSAAGWKRTLPRGASVLIKVRLSAAWNATIGTTKAATVTAAWGGDVVLRDTVKAGVKVVR